MLDLAQLAGDIPADLANRAHAGTSFSPERRGAQESEAYAAQLASDYDALASLATTDERREVLAAEFARYREGYRRRTVALLGARGACVSTMIAGPANFNVRRAEKRSATADRRAEDLTAYRSRALAAIRKRLAPEQGPIMSGDADALDRLRERLQEAEALHASMLATNIAIRSNAKRGAAAQVAALVELGHSEHAARSLLLPDQLRRIGYPSYMVTNNGAEIRRLKARIEGVSRAKATPSEAIEGPRARLEDCPAESRVRLFFPGKPEREVIARLKSSGFRWTPTLGCWTGYRSALAAAREIAGV